MIDTNQLSKIETNVKDSDKEAFEASVHKYKWAVIVGAAIFTFVALVAFFGYVCCQVAPLHSACTVLTLRCSSFVGSIIRNRRMVKAYSVLTIFSFFLGSAAAGFVLYATWANKPFCVTVDNVKSCTESSLNTGGKIGLTIGIVVQWFIQLCESPFLPSLLRPAVPAIACPAQPAQTHASPRLASREFAIPILSDARHEAVMLTKSFFQTSSRSSAATTSSSRRSASTATTSASTPPRAARTRRRRASSRPRARTRTRTTSTASAATRKVSACLCAGPGSARAARVPGTLGMMMMTVYHTSRAPGRGARARGGALR